MRSKKSSAQPSAPRKDEDHVGFKKQDSDGKYRYYLMDKKSNGELRAGYYVWTGGSWTWANKGSLKLPPDEFAQLISDASSAGLFRD